MSTVYPPSDDVAAIRARIDHPIIDNDGHIIEYLPLVRDIVVDLAGEDVAKRFDLVVDSGRLTQMLTADQRRELALARVPWWGIPTRNTLDRATAMLPQLLYQRLDQLGIDVAVVYPTYGLTAIHLADDELRRRGVARVQHLRRRGVRAVPGPHPSGRLHPDVHARRSDRGARVRGAAGSACAQ